MSGERRYTDNEGNELVVGPLDSYILEVRGDDCLRVSMTHLQRNFDIDFQSKAERDAAVAALARDHNVWQDDVQINPRGENYGRHIDEITGRWD
jgi:hypothetical protein